MPTEQDIVRLPYFAILALGARSARYVEPLFRTWKRAPDEHVRAVSGAIQAIEELARCPDAVARQPFWVSAADAALLAADAASAADRANAPTAALRAADSAAELANAIDPDRPRRTAARAVLRSIQASAHAIEETGSGREQEFIAQIGEDVKKLRLHASVERWTDETGVPVQILDS